MKKTKVTLIALLVIIIAIGISIQSQRYKKVSNMEQMIENSENQVNAYSSLTEYSSRYKDDLAIDKYIEGTQAFYKVYTKQTGEKYKGKNYIELTPTELMGLITYSRDNVDLEIVRRVEGGLTTEEYEKAYYGFIMDLLDEEKARLRAEIARANEETNRLKEENEKLREEIAKRKEEAEK